MRNPCSHIIYWLTVDDPATPVPTTIKVGREDVLKAREEVKRRRRVSIVKLILFWNVFFGENSENTGFRNLFVTFTLINYLRTYSYIHC